MRKKIFAIVVAMVIVFGGYHFLPKKHTQVQAQQYGKCLVTGTSPLNCQSSGYGIVTIAAAASSVVVNTTAVPSNAIIELTYDASTATGTTLGVTCNVTAQQPYVSARSAGGNFTISTASTFTTNPGCIQFEIITQ